VISPYAIRAILSIIYPIAKYHIRAHMRDTLRFLNQPEFFYQMKQDLQDLKDGSVINFENALYLQKGVRINPAIFRSDHDILFNQVDFRFTRRAAQIFNQWATNSTNGKINNLIIENDINANSVLLLLNAVYFEAEWEKRFSPYTTTKRAFYSIDGRRTEIDSMQISEEYFMYYNDYKSKFKIIEIPYQTKIVKGRHQKIVMWILLPKFEQTLQGLVKKLTFTKVLEASQKMNYSKVDVQLPKFRIKYGFNVKKVLQTLGLEPLFEPNALNITSSGEELVDGLVQKTYIAVGEEGTSAAAIPRFKCKYIILKIQREILF
jgi:serpin B